MSVQAALQFIRQVRRREDLKDQIRALGLAPALDSLIQVGSKAGFAFTAEELQTAYKHDWVMRWMHYSGPRQT